MSQEPIRNLWGELPEPQIITSPLSMLKEQAALLSETTKGLLVGEVRRNDKSYMGISSSLFVRVPSMGNYLSRICTVDHGPLLYPLVLTNAVTDDIYDCEDEKYFEEALSAILSSSDVHKLIRGLMSAARASAE